VPTGIAEFVVRKGTILSKYIASSCRGSNLSSGLQFRETNQITVRVVSPLEKEGMLMVKLSIPQLQGVYIWGTFSDDILGYLGST
jgi:hypothetical protein